MKSTAKAITVYGNKILLILRDDIPTISDPNAWNFPGGEVDEGESYEDAMLREFEEELSIVPKNVKFLGYLIVSENVKHGIFYIKLAPWEVEQLKLGNEGQEFRFFSFDELNGIKLTKVSAYYFSKYGAHIKEISEESAKIVPEMLGLTA